MHGTTGGHFVVADGAQLGRGPIENASPSSAASKLRGEVGLAFSKGPRPSGVRTQVLVRRVQVLASRMTNFIRQYVLSRLTDCTHFGIKFLRL